MYTYYRLMGGCTLQRQTPCTYKRILYNVGMYTNSTYFKTHTLKLHYDRSFKQRLL